MVRKNFEKDLYYIGMGEKYTCWNVFPDEANNQDFPTIFLLLEIVILNLKICTMI